MKLHLFEDARDLQGFAATWLETHEALNNIFFGVLASASRYQGTNFWGAVTENGQIVGVAFRTPPWPVAVAHGTTAQALVLLLDELWERYDDDFDMMLSPLMAHVVSRHAASVGRATLTKRMGQAVYEVREVRPPTGVPGRVRAATLSDVEVVMEWMLAFHDEAIATDHDDATFREHARRSAQDMTAAGEVYLWDVDGRPVSMAAARGTTPRGIRISWVFTPLALRKNGYASACVAALSQGQLDAGREACFLFTDLANPTSNRIYQEIGYEYVGEMNVYKTMTDE